MKQPICFDCIHAHVSKGYMGDYYQPPEPSMAECEIKIADKIENEKLNDIGEQYEWDENIMPQYCGHFSPHLIEQCAREGCKKEMNVPRYSHEYWVMSRWGDAFAVCCDGCKVALEVEEALEQMDDEDNSGYVVNPIR